MPQACAGTLAGKTRLNTPTVIGLLSAADGRNSDVLHDPLSWRFIDRDHTAHPPCLPL